MYLVVTPAAFAQDPGLAAGGPETAARDKDPFRPVPLLGLPAPQTPWTDVIGVPGASAPERVETLNRMTEGRVVLIDFWATWCRYCIQSMPHVLRLAHREGPDSVLVIFATYLDQRNTREEVKTFVEHDYKNRYGVEFDGIVALIDDASAYLQWLKGGIPRFVVLDQKGIVRHEGSGAAAPAVNAAEALLARSPEVAGDGSRSPVSVSANLTIEQRITEAERAIDEGRFDEAEEIYRAILAEAPDHDVAYSLLWELSRGRTLDVMSRPYERARRALPGSFEQRETSHFVIFSDADPTWVREQGDLLEQTYDQFIRFTIRLGLRPLPVAHKLVAIAFENSKDFRELAGGDGVPWPGFVAGYYSPSEDRLVFYRAESSANVARERQELEALLAEIEAIERASRRARAVARREDARQIAEGLQERVEDFTERQAALNLLARRQTISVTVHEAVHQLMFHTRVQAPGVVQPRWLSEGLATAFETDAPNKPFGPAHEYEPRRQAFRKLLDDDTLLPLRDLVTSGKTSNTEYDQAYALVTWMCRFRRGELRDYLLRVNAMPRGPVSPEAHRATFEASFGDIDLLERRWLQFERSAD